MTAPDHMLGGTNLSLHEPGHPHMEASGELVMVVEEEE